MWAEVAPGAHPHFRSQSYARTGLGLGSVGAWLGSAESPSASEGSVTQTPSRRREGSEVRRLRHDVGD